MALPAVALAQTPSTPSAPSPSDTAREHYKRGNDLYDLRRYTEAAHEYEAAFEQHADPALLFDIAQAYRFADDYPKAIIAYRSYLRREPRAKNKNDVLALIADLQRLAADQRKSKDQPPNGPESPTALQEPANPSPKPTVTVEPAPSPVPVVVAPVVDTPPPDTGRPKRLAGIGAIVGGVVVAGVGAVLVGEAYATQNEYNHPSTPGKTVFSSSAQSRITAEQGAGGALVGVGLAAVAAGAVLEVIGKRPTHVAWAPSFGDHQASINLAGVWP